MSETNDAGVDTARCPRCGEPNLCAMAAGLVDEACWCTQIEFAPQVFAKVPPDERGRRCLCPKCAVEP